MYPWYTRPTFVKRRGPAALRARLRGKVLPGDDEKYVPEGVLTRKLGPVGLTAIGQKKVEEEVTRLGELFEEPEYPNMSFRKPAGASKP